MLGGIETNNEAPKDTTQEMGEFMPEAEPMKEKKEGPKTNYEAKPLTDEEMDRKVGKPRTELTGGDKVAFSDIIDQAKDTIKDNSPDGKVSHGDAQAFNIEGVDYVYLRDESQKGAANKDRLFKKE